MRQRLAIRFLSGVALAAILSVSALNGARAEDKPAAPEINTPVAFDRENVDTFAGAFLAARTADVDHDYDTAIALYKKALMIEPGNPEIRQRLMISLLLNGNLEEGVKYANELKSDPSVERVTTIVRGMDAIRRHEYRSAQDILKYNGPNDLDRMMTNLLSAWARAVGGSEDGTAGQVTAEGDPVRGKEVYEKRCTGCHAMTSDREGPRLQSVYGRTSGTVPGFDYSPAIKQAHIVWNEASLDKWLTDPDVFVPGNNMEFHVPNPQERRDLVRFLKEAAGTTP